MENRTERIPLKRVELNSTVLVLWDRTHSPGKLQIKIDPALPVLEFPEAILHTLRSGSSIPCFLLGKKQPFSNQIRLTEPAFTHRPMVPCDYSIKIQCRSLARPDFEFILQSILFKIDSYAEIDCLDPLDLCKTTLIYSSRQRIKLSLVFPSFPLYFQQIHSISIVSTPLSISLMKGKQDSLATGYLTMDSKQRVVPLSLSDPNAFNHPLIGVWISGVKDIHSPYAWAACVRYIESKLIPHRISPEHNCFLFIHFKARPAFYEVSLDSGGFWTSLHSVYNVHRNEHILCDFPSRFTLKTQLSSLTSSEEKATRDTYSSTDPQIKHHGKQILHLIEQLSSLKAQLEGMNMKHSTSTNTSFGKPTEHSAQTDRTITVPTINYYTSLNDSDEEGLHH